MRRGIVPFVLGLCLAGTGGTAATGDAMTEPKNVIDFRDADDRGWFVVNDGVMGGVSRGGIRRTDAGTGLFSGVLSLENNGGFSSVRTGLDTLDLSPYAGVEVRVRGDGRTYQLRFRLDDGVDGVAYRAQFPTRGGEWTTTRLSFDEFLPTFRGRVLRDVPPLDTSRLRQLAFLLADGRPGAFSLEIEFVRPWTAEPIAP